MDRPQIDTQIDYSIGDSDFAKTRMRLIWVWLVVSVSVVFMVEFILFKTMAAFTELPDGWILVIDGIFLVLVLFPLNYLFIIRPMIKRISDAARVNSALLKSDEIFEHFFSVSDMLIAYMDNRFNFIRVNQTYADADEHPPEYFVGKNHFDLYPNEENRRLFQTVLDSGNPYSIVDKPFVYSKSPERGLSYWDWNLFPIKDVSGKVLELLLVLINVTERHNNLLAKAESDSRFRAVFDQTYHFNFLTDSEGVVMMVNRSGMDFMQRPIDELLGKPIWELPNLAPDTEIPLREALNEAIAGKVVRRPLKVHYANGDPCVLEAAAKAVVNSEGQSELILFEALDLTRMVNSEEALKEDELKLEQLYITEKAARTRAELLRNAVIALAKSPDVNSVYEILLDYSYENCPYDLAHIFIFDEDNVLEVSHARGEELLVEGERLMGKRLDPEGLHVLSQLLLEHKIVSVEDVEREPLGNVLFPSFPLGSWVAFPLVPGTEVIGILVLGHREKNHFSKDVIQWTDSLVSQSAITIQNKWLFDQVSENRERLQALARRLVQVQEKERRYVAQELHDETGQALAAIKVGLMVIERERSDPEAVIRRCNELNVTADEVLENLHRLAMDLRPAALDHLGLVPALRQQVEILSEQHGIAMTFDTIGIITRLPGEIETTIYRIVQEALTNVIKHAHATNVDIMFERRTNDLLIIVEDNGIGFSPHEMASAHLGTIGMSERATSVGGSLRIESSPGEGTAVFLEVPCPSES